MIRASTQDIAHLPFISSVSCGSSTLKPMIYMWKPRFWFFVLQLFHMVWDNRLFRGLEIVKSQVWSKITLDLASSLWCSARFTVYIKQSLDRGELSMLSCFAACLCLCIHLSTEKCKLMSLQAQERTGTMSHTSCSVEEMFFFWDFAEISSLIQGNTSSNQSQCWCKCSRNH